MVYGHLSDEKPLTSGVPQGWILGPPFFIIAVNSLAGEIGRKRTNSVLASILVNQYLSLFYLDGLCNSPQAGQFDLRNATPKQWNLQLEQLACISKAAGWNSFS